MKSSLAFIILLISTGLIACEENSSTTCIYEKHDIRFSYESPWHIEEESGWFSNPYVFLETPNSGLIMVMILPKETHKSLQDFAAEYSQSASSQLLLGSFKSAGFSDITAKTNHIGMQENLVLSIFDEAVPMTRQYFSFTSAEKTTYIIIQLEDDELDDISGLEQVLTTFEFVEIPTN